MPYVPMSAGGGGGETITPTWGPKVTAVDGDGYITEVEYYSSAPDATFVPQYSFYAPSTATTGMYYRLKKLTFMEPCNLEKLETWAFYNCPELEIDRLPDSITSIGSTCFYKNQKLNLKEVLLPVASSSNAIEGGAFSMCTGLKTLKLRAYQLGTSGTATNANPLSGCTGLTHVWLSKEIVRIWASSSNIQVFRQCSKSLKIFTDVPDADSIPSSWGSFWNYVDSTLCETSYNVSESEFEQIVNDAYGEPIY